ncbi:MAG: hypothetical protein U0324_46385 [Polyangiales bacterium]
MDEFAMTGTFTPRKLNTAAGAVTVTSNTVAMRGAGKVARGEWP